MFLRAELVRNDTPGKVFERPGDQWRWRTKLERPTRLSEWETLYCERSPWEGCHQKPMNALLAQGYIEGTQETHWVSDHPVTIFRITQAGRDAYNAYVEWLEKATGGVFQSRLQRA